MKKLIVLFAAAIAVGCVSGQEITRITTNERQVVFRHCDEGFAAVQAQAESHCKQFGKEAVIKNTTSHQSGSCPPSWRGGHLVPGTEHTTVYDCK